MKLQPLENPPNPYTSRHAEWLEPAPPARLQILNDTSASILSRNDSPDIPFTWSVNPYRGCQHACAYCYARRTHEYFELGAGSDFDTKIAVKQRAADLLREAFSRKSWKRESVTFSGVTDCYQPLEAAYGITRACLEVCVEFANPACVITKGFLVVRDIDVLRELNRVAAAQVFISIPFCDPEICAAVEPQAPPPARRLEAVRRLSEQGIPTGVMVAPIIPGLNDVDIPRILEASSAAGARWAGYTALRLPGSVGDVFTARLRTAFPLRAERILNRVRDMRGGALNDSRFGNRMRGDGSYWDSVRDLFRMHRKRLGLDQPMEQQVRGADLQAEPESAGETQLEFGFG